MEDRPTQTDAPVPMRRGRLLACTFGHALSDCFANFVPPLWFTVQRTFGISDPALGLISLLLSATTNFGQPIFGYVVDRWRLRNVIPFSLLVATVFVSLVGFMPNLPLFVLFVMFSGLGIALFHPRGGSLAAEASGSRRALGMSIFGAGGAVGFAASSLAAPLLHSWGERLGLGPLQGFIFVLPPGLAAVALITKYNPGRNGYAVSAEVDRFSLRQHLLPYLRPMAPLLAVMVLRSATVVAYATFMQVLQGRLGHSTLFQGAVLFSFTTGAAIGGIVGGHLSDIYGRRFMTVLTLLLAPPLLYGALHVSPVWVMVLLFLAGATLRGAESVNIAQMQDLLPNGMSTASALSMGFTWGVAGFMAPLVGLVSEWAGSLSVALGMSCALPVIAAVVALKLPTRPELPGQLKPQNR